MLELATVRMSAAKAEAKRYFLLELNRAKHFQIDWADDPAIVICRYLDKVHKVQLPEDFVDQINSAHREFHYKKNLICLPFATIDTICSACDLWKEYLSDSDEIFDNFVCSEILSMLRLHTSVIAGRNIHEDYSLRKSPPYKMVTIVTRTGALLMYP